MEIELPPKRIEGSTLEERMTENAFERILPGRYLKKDSDGNIVEEPKELFERVAKNIAVAEAVWTDGAIHIRPEVIKPDHPRREELIEEVFTEGGRQEHQRSEVPLTEKNAKWVAYDPLINHLRKEGHEEAAQEVETIRESFEVSMKELAFMPNSPTLMNAGDELQQLSACFVDSPGDDMDDIHETAKEASLVFQSGGGMGYAFSNLRPYGDQVGSTGGIASGPLTFMRTYDQMCETIAQGGTRRGAQMGIMRISHPDVIFFIHAKNKDVSLARTLKLNDPDDPKHTSFGDALDEARELIDDDGKVPEHLRNAAEAHLSNFNISVAVTDEFMECVERDELYTFTNPRTGEPHIATQETKEMYSWFGLGHHVTVGEPLEVPAQKVWDAIIGGAHENGEPGVVFIDRINEEHSFPAKSTPDRETGEYEMLATNPCGEQPLMEYEACNLGHINLSTLVDDDAELWDEWRNREGPLGRMDEAEVSSLVRDYLEEALRTGELERRVHIGTRFLDNVVTMSDFPIEEIEETVRKNRKIGLGIMGLAQLLTQLGIPYGSDIGNEASAAVMEMINHWSKEASRELAEMRGKFSNWEDSKYANPPAHADWFHHHTGETADEWEDGYPIRNHNTTTIAPTGTTSMLANTSGGCEPIYNVAYYKNVSDDVQGDEMLVEFDDYFLRVLEANDIDVEEAREEAAEQMANNEFDGAHSLETVPDQIANLFVTTGDLDGIEHAAVQCALQDHVDSAISKTVNAPNEATASDTDDAFHYVYQNGGKGITYYRDGTRSKQVVTTRAKNSEFSDDMSEMVCGCGDYSVHVPETPEAFDIVCPECGNHFGEGEAKSAENGHEARKRPKVTFGETHLVSTSSGKMYVTINEDDHGIHEVFVTIGKSGGFTESLCEALGRQISLSLRAGVDVGEVIDQLEDIRGPQVQWDEGQQVTSIPDGIAIALKRYMEGRDSQQVGGGQTGVEVNEMPSGLASLIESGENPECPDCESMLRMSEGCKECPSCGWSKC